MTEKNLKTNPHEFTFSEINLTDYILIILKRKWVLLNFALIIITLSTIYTFRMKPIYRATVQILIENSPNIVGFQQINTIDTGADNYFNTQCKILKSRWLASQTLEKLKKEQLIPIFFPQHFSFEDLSSYFLSLIEVEPIRGTQLVNVSIRSFNPVYAAKLANLLTQTFIELDLETKLISIRQATRWLADEVRDIETKMKISKDYLRQYLANNNLITLESKLSIITEKIAIISKALNEAKTKEIQLQEKYRATHPTRLRLVAEINSLEQNLKTTLAEQQEISLELEQKKVEYGILQNEVETNRQLYAALLTRFKETDITGGIKFGNVRIIDQAVVPKKPFLPNKKNNFIISLVFSIIGGIGLIYFIEYLDDTLKTEDEIKHYLKLPILGYIPSIKLSKIEKTKFEQYTYVYTYNKSHLAEECRNIRTQILAWSNSNKIKSVLVTSSSPNEGKSITTTNLAITMAQIGAKVLLVEGDLRRPVFKKVLGLSSNSGLSDYLTGKETELNTYITPLLLDNLNVLPCGSIPHTPTELLVSPKMHDLMIHLKNNDQFDFIFFDSPPALNIADTLILASLCDVTIYVIRAVKLSRRLINTGKEKIEQIGAKILGVIVNGIDLEKHSYRYYNYYHYYHYGEPKSKNKKISNQEKITI